jgi:DNA-binding MarR family transcriptional regulator
VASPPPQAIQAIRAWYRLDRAFTAAGQHLRRTTGATGEQVAICRIVAERDAWAMSELRARLTMHPATLGQAVARLEERGLVRTRPDESDGRRRQVSITQVGRDLLGAIPLVGPVRLRATEASLEDLAAMTRGFTLAIELFGLQPWADDPATIQTKEKER